MNPTLAFTGSAVLLGSALLSFLSPRPSWSAEEVERLAELRLVAGPAAPDPSNRYASSEEAAALGHELFFDARFSSNGKVSCATCHLPEAGFQDGTQLGHGVGTTGRRTMPLAGIDGSSWFFWDGRKDSLWSQALGPLESPVEHGGDRVQYARLIASAYRAPYERIFGPLPDLSGLPAHAGPNGSREVRAAWAALPAEKQDAVSRVFANMGKAIAAYERKLQPAPSRFDTYVDAVVAGKKPNDLLTADEEAGLRLFLGKANCTECHNGPMLSNHDFANTGVPAVAGMPGDTGRAEGTRDVLDDEFNCLGPYSDAKPEACRELRYLVADHHALRQFKVPSLRNVADRAPYMHAGQFPTLEAVVDHYDRAPATPMGELEIRPLGLDAKEKTQLVQFLRTLSSPLATDARWLRAPGPVPELQLAVTLGDGETTLDGSTIVDGSAALVAARLADLEGWPELFRDVRAMKPHKDGTWGIDNKAFGHVHGFRPVVHDAGLRLDLADTDHGKASLDYRVEPQDAAHAKVVVRFHMTTPETLTQAQVAHVLRAKATVDLEDLARLSRKETP